MTDNGERTVLNDRYEIQQRIGRGGMALSRESSFDAVMPKRNGLEDATDVHVLHARG